MQTATVDPSISRSPLPRDAADLPTVCVLCSHNCSLRVDVKDGRIVELRGDETSPITRGYLCNKASFTGVPYHRYVPCRVEPIDGGD